MKIIFLIFTLLNIFHSIRCEIGLFHRNSQSTIPLTDIEVKINIVDFLAKVTISQTYKNSETNPIECVYKFPIDEKAAIDGFEAEIDGHVVYGISKERNEAFKEYDQAINEGHTAYLMEEERADLFTMSVGNLPPGKEAIIRITYLTEIGLEGESLRFVLPTTFIPKFHVPSTSRPVTVPEGLSLEAPRTNKIPYSMKLDAKIEMSTKIEKISSPTHPIEVSITNQRFSEVQLSTKTKELDKDFVLIIHSSNSNHPRVWIEENKKDKSYSGLLVLQDIKYFKENVMKREVSKEIIFLIDISGSMHGDPIAYTKKALLNALDIMESQIKKEKQIYFNIVLFSDTFQHIFPESVPATKQNLYNARQFAERIESLGGTVVLPALQWIYHNTPKSTDQSILFLTDGAVSNTYDVIDEVRKGKIKMFSIGVGYAVDRELVNGVASAGKGIAEYCIPGESVQEKVERQLRRIIEDQILEISSIQWGDSKVHIQTPFYLPHLYEDSRVLVYSFLDKFPTQDVKVEFSDGTSWSVSPNKILSYNEGDVFHKLCARSRIRDLENGFIQKSASLQFRNIPNTSIKDEIVALATKYNLLSKETAFVAVDETQNSNPQNMILREVPILNPSGSTFGFNVPMHQNFQPLMRALKLESNILLLDVLPLTLGISFDSKTYERMILRNAVIPSKKSKTFIIPATESLNFSVYQGENDDLTLNVLMEELSIPLPIIDNTSQLSVTIFLEIDVNAIVWVTVEIPDCNFHFKKKISNQRNLSQEEIDQMVR